MTGPASPADQVRVRTADAADLPALREVYRRSSLSNAGEVDVLLAHPEVLVLPDANVLGGRTRVAVDPQGVLVGFATVVGDGPSRELDDLFVDPDHQRRGVATLLLADAAERTRRDGATRIEVTGNPHALEFYESVGFVRVGEVSTELGTGIRMHLDVSAPGRE